MRGVIAAAAATAILLLIGFATASLPRGEAGRVASQREEQAVNARFAIKFCYSQYKSQTDISRCLLRNTGS
ncbi:MAG TPA: hypothetical protein VFA50_16470 [Stellaceae bacterium]|nr:hypothetical protein [Stellaceae bacterium]